MIKYIMVVILVLVLLLSCREAITYDNEPDEYIYEVCDTISTKLNYPEVGYTTYTIRCTDQFGNERTYLIIDKP